jgi:hypothetical protein
MKMMTKTSGSDQSDFGKKVRTMRERIGRAAPAPMQESTSQIGGVKKWQRRSSAASAIVRKMMSPTETCVFI